MVLKIVDNLLYTKTLSMFTLMLTNVQDFGFIMFFLISAIKNPKVLNYYFLLFFLFLFIETFLSMRILLFTWRIKNNFLNNNQINTAEFKKKFYIFQIKFYSFLVIFYMLMHYLFTFHPMVILASSFIYVPQILTNLNIQIHELDKPYILFFALPRFFIYFYFRIYPFNTEELKPYPIVMGLSFFVLIFSIIIIYLQGQYGSFFFLPKCLRWKQFNYFVKVSKIKKIFSNSLDIKNDNESRNSRGSFLKRIFSSWKKKKDSSQTDLSTNSIISKNISQTQDQIDFIQMDSIIEGKSRISSNTETDDLSCNHTESNIILYIHYNRFIIV